MRDPLDTRIGAFVVELLDDPPAAPPFPHPDAVVISGDRTERRKTMATTDRREPATRQRGLLVAAMGFAAVLLVGLAVVLLQRKTTSPARPTRSTSFSRSTRHRTQATSMR